MLEMLNPTGGDMLRFAAQVVRVRKQLNSALKLDQTKAQALAVELFCSPPEGARLLPDLARLKADSTRFFGWKLEQWKAHEAQLNSVVNSAKHSTLLHDGLNIHCYYWPSEGKPRGRMLLCHGWEGYALNFALLIQTAIKAGYQVYAFDHLAHGRSQGYLSGLPIALETLLTVSAHVEKTAGSIDILVGHSLGGAAASWAVANGAIKPKRLSLIAPFYDTYKLSKQWAMAHFLSEQIRDLLQSGLEAASGKTFADFMPESLAKKYNQTKTPVLIVHDRADKITAFKHSGELAKLASNVSIFEARGLGHIAVLADQACAKAIVRFADEGSA
jgi:pimeloyl-ACP methyl ester carboxylesterase